ncbi:MAG: hypothetical protein ABIQ01_01820, partial [Pseudolysinimonas sp.]
EASRLANVTTTGSGRAYSLWDASGPLAAAHQRAWDDWGCAVATAVCTGPGTVRETIAPFLQFFSVLHVLLIAVLMLPLLVKFRPAARPRPQGRGRVLRWLVMEFLGPRWMPVIAIALAVVLAVAQWVFIGDVRFAAWAVDFPAFLGIMGSAVWAAVLLSVVMTFADRSGAAGTFLSTWARPSRRALRTQRLPFIALLVFAVMGTVSGHGVLEQVPDVVRGWVLVGDGGERRPGDVAAAFFGVLLIAFALWLIARQRTTRIAIAADEDPAINGRKRAVYWPWFVIIGAAAVGGLVVAVVGAVGSSGPFAFLDLRTLIAFAGVLGGILLLSAILTNRTTPEPKRYDPVDAKAALLFGDVIPALFIATLFISIAKAYIGPWLLGGDIGGSVQVAGVAFGAIAFALVCVPALLIAAPRVAKRIPGPVGLVLDTTSDAEPRSLSVARAISTAIAAVVLLAALIVPRFLTVLGPVGILVLLVGAWVVVLAFISTQLSQRRPLPLFERLGMRTDPILSLALLVPLVLTQTGGPAAVHALTNSGTDPLPADRPGIADVVTDWTTIEAPGAATSSDCAGRAANDDPASYVRPLVLVAAEGGGIRAAEWTVDVMQGFDLTTCTRNAVAMSSGVSGGAVGLALLHQRPMLKSPQPIEKFVVGQADVVSLAIAGLLVRDAIASLTGVRVPTLFTDGSWRWEDRASLIESQWRESESGLSRVFDAQPAPVTGHVVLNSLAANVDCKVVVSQVDLNEDAQGRDPDSEGAADAPINCNEDDGELSTTIDLIDYLHGCPLSIDWATAALSAARFPYVTPAGRLSDETIVPGGEGCQGLRDLQLIDGGYFDNSGLGTLSDTAPQFVDAISALNAVADGTPANPYTIPIVVYLHNEPGGDVISDSDRITADLAVPVLNLDAGNAQHQADAWLSRLSTELENVCGFADEADHCTDVVTAFRTNRVPHGVAVVAPATLASLSVPLGWTLSGESEDQLRQAVATEASFWTPGKRCPDAPVTDRERYYATLGEVMCAIDLRPPKEL